MTSTFLPGLRGLPSDTGPRSLAITGSSSPELGPLSRVRHRFSPAWLPQQSDTSLGFFLFFATQVRGIHLLAGFSYPPTVRPQRFSRSRRFAPPHTVRACFIPQPRPRFHFRGFPQQPADLAHRQPVPSCRLLVIACGRVTPPTPAITTSPSGLWSGCRSVATDRFFTPANNSIPS